jgi:hypothetical protein
MSWLSKITGVDVKIGDGGIKAKVDWGTLGKNLLLGAVAPGLFGVNIPLFSQAAEKLGLSKLTQGLLSKAGITKFLEKNPQLAQGLKQMFNFGQLGLGGGGGDLTSLLGGGGLPGLNLWPILGLTAIGYAGAKPYMEQQRQAISQLFDIVDPTKGLWMEALRPSIQQIPQLAQAQNQILNLLMRRLPRG